MPFTAPIVGYITRLGYQLCVSCSAGRDDLIPDSGVHGDSYEPDFDGNCEGCGAPLATATIRSAGYVHVEPGQAAPDIRPDHPNFAGSKIPAGAR